MLLTIKVQHYFAGRTEEFNGYLKIFNMAMQFLRQITKHSVKKKSNAFGTTFHLKVSSAVSMTGSLKYSQSSFMQFSFKALTAVLLLSFCIS